MEMCQGPKDITRRPTLKLPPLSCDCHSHILGPQDRFPYVEDRSFTPPDASTDSYLKMLGTIGIERMIIVQPSVYGANNERTVTAVAELGQHRSRGVAMVAAGVSPAELRRLDEAGIRATRFIATARGGPTLDQLPDVARAIEPFGWHIEMYVPPELWDDLLPVIESLPVPVVFDHMGGIPADATASHPNLRKILDLLSRERCWAKLTGYRNSLQGPPFDDLVPLARMFVESAPHRCVWGSDWPHTNMPDYMPDDGDLVELLEDWAPDAAVLSQIMVDNPARLYRF